ncbi:MAG: glycosyltransferase [Candidatus Bathyarchaeia archaeon]
MDVLKPNVTIGVCVHNCESTILETVQSIIAQDYPHELLEVIVVDKYSSDKTVQIVKEALSHSDIENRVFFENKGLGFARQIVVNESKGKYIVWVDGDMILPRDFIKKQVEFMERNPRLGVAKGRYGIIKEDSLVATLENIDFVTTFNREGWKMPDVLGTSGCIYRVKAIKEAGGFDENITGVGEDMDIEYKIKTAGWELRISPAYFYERRRKTWQALWREYFWHGKGGFYIYRKKLRVFRKLPFSAIFAKCIQSAYAYRLTYTKKAFLLPMHYIFKRTAWISGFLAEFMKSIF